MFRLNAVRAAVDGRTLVGPITLDIPAGRMVGIVGHNGCGKSTLLSLLARQRIPHSGEISFQGVPLPQWRRRTLAQRIAYLPQAIPDAPGMLVRELVALGRYPWHGATGRFGTKDNQAVDRALGLANVEAFSHRPVSTLSGGERQRAWLAMLIAQEAECLLLDEPTSALDIAHQVEVLRLLHHLSDQHDVSTVVILHDINMAVAFCHEIIALRGGDILFRGSPSDIATPENLQATYGIEMGVIRHPVTGTPVAFVK